MRRDLIERAMAGDHDAFSELARAAITRLYAAARLILRDDANAEDAVQEALVAAWRDLSALRDPDRFEAWLHRLLVRACLREARRGRRRWSIESEVRPMKSVEPDLAVDIADRDELARGFARLDPDQRTVIVLHHYLGLTLDEVADALAVPPGTARSRLHRAIRTMRAALDADARPTITEGRLA
ncbi:MAG: RNA polymerase sigma factor [Candidatus Limnocylindrales bacterium]